MPSVQLKREQYNAAFKYVASLIDAGHVAPNSCAQDMFDRVDAIIKLARKVALLHAARPPYTGRKYKAFLKVRNEACFKYGLPADNEAAWKDAPYMEMAGLEFPSVLFEL